MHLINNLILLDNDGPIKRGFKIVDFKPVFDIQGECDEYMLYCAKSYSSICTALEKARVSISLLDYSYILKIESTDNAKSVFIELFIENTIIRVQSIYDRVLIFINRLLGLGISNESINHTLLVTNVNLIRYGLDKKLKSLNKACSD